TLREKRRVRIEQQARRFDRVARDTDDAGLLPVLHAFGIDINDPCRLAVRVMLDSQHLAFGADFEIAGRLAAGQFGIERRPFRAGFAALEAEADLQAGWAFVARFAVDRHAAGADLRIADLPRAGFENLVIIVTGQA